MCFKASDAESIIFRDEVGSADSEAVMRIVRSTGSFYPEEMRVAVELVEERLAKGIDSGYHFIFAQTAGRVVGYACFGPIPCTRSSFDIYWIAVEKEFQGKGLGKMLLSRLEETIVSLGGADIYVETSSRAEYEATRSFYAGCGYVRVAELEDFYARGDSKVICVKRGDHGRV